MRKKLFWLWVGLLGLTLMTSTAYAVRNPFGVSDIEDPLGADVMKFADGRQLQGGRDDKNAGQWVMVEMEGKSDSIDGEWSGRWEEGVGTAMVKTVKDRVYVLYTDHEGRLKGQTWLLEALRQGNRLVGRWAQIGNPNDTGAFVGLIVDKERIDGAWVSTDSRPADLEVFSPSLRWDFRRKLKK